MEKYLDIYVLKTYNNKCKQEVANTKRTDLIKLLEKNGWYKVREGGNHTVYTNGKEIEAVPRHKEIAEFLAKAIIKRHKLK